MSLRQGGCHCGSVRFEIDAPTVLRVQDCNCSICSRTGYLHLIVPSSRFRLLSGADQLARYSFGTHIAQHLFCRICGIKSYYIPRSNPDGVSVNARCLDDVRPEELVIEPFDGRHWDENAHTLAALSVPDRA